MHPTNIAQAQRKKCPHQFIGIMTIDGCLWCKWCDKWIKVIKPEFDPELKKGNK